MVSHCVQQESGVALTSPRGPFSHPWVTLSCRTYTREKTLNLCRIFPKLIFFPVRPLYRPNVLKTFLVGVYSFVSCSVFCDTCSTDGFMEHDYLEGAGCIHLAQLPDILTSRTGGQEETLGLSLSRPPQMSPQPASSPLPAEQHRYRSLSPTL